MLGEALAHLGIHAGLVRMPCVKAVHIAVVHAAAMKPCIGSETPYTLRIPPNDLAAGPLAPLSVPTPIGRSVMNNVPRPSIRAPQSAELRRDEKLLIGRQEAAAILSISLRALDYLVQTSNSEGDVVCREF